MLHAVPNPMVVHLNGRLVPREEATVSVFDRGFLMGDGIYEGLRSAQGVVVGLDMHVNRMREGMAELRLDRLAGAFDPGELGRLTTELLEANRLAEAFVYWQVTRGTPGPDDPVRARLPAPGARPTVFAYASPLKPALSYAEPETRSAALRPDTRWRRGHVKGISLLGGVLAAIEADEHGCDDAVLHRDGLVTEGTATNVFLVPRGSGAVVTPSLMSAPMLAGVTRAILMRDDPSITERAVTIDELLEAEEIMLAGTITMVAAVTRLDGRPVGDAAARGFRPGPHARRLLDTLVSSIRREIASARRPERTHA